MNKLFFLFLVFLFLGNKHFYAEDEKDFSSDEIDLSGQEELSIKKATVTEDDTVKREDESIRLDGMSNVQFREMLDHAKKYEYQTEVSKVMQLIINSLYQNKEIFLRELISNASDALDKIRYLSLTEPEALSAKRELEIKIFADKENNLLHILDSGVGMSKEDLIKNLGTIAKSGTSEFMSKMKSAENSKSASDLIGQFGVGFYSAFLVADRVVVASKCNEDEKQHIWTSDASSFSVVEDARGDSLKRGTQITLHLKDEAKDFLKEATLEKLVNKYSQFINFPIYLLQSKEVEVEEEEVKPEDAEAKKNEEAAEDKVEEDDAKVEDEKTEDKKEEKKKKKEMRDEWTLMNDQKPIWLRKPADVSEEEYAEFYKAFTQSSEMSLAHTHFSAEGDISFKSILFVPSYNSNDFSSYGKPNDNIKLFVRRVFITSHFPKEILMPSYLSFLKGLVDSDDLPLNVSRELLQQNKLLKIIKKKLVRKALEMFKNMADDVYEKFYKEYSTNLKVGVIEDVGNRNRILNLLRFHSTNDSDKKISLKEYVKRMKPSQKVIYYISGISLEEARKSPFSERLISKGYEILLLNEAIDEHFITHVAEFDGKKLQNLAKGNLEESSSKKAEAKIKELEAEHKNLLDWLREAALKDKIKVAKISQRLQSSPCAIVADTYGWSGNMERLMKSQAYAKAGDTSTNYYASMPKTFEINVRHPLIKHLKEKFEEESTHSAEEEDGDVDSEKVSSMKLAEILYDNAVLRSGFTLPDPKEFSDSIDRLLKISLGIPADTKADIVEDDEEEEEEEKEKEEGSPTSEENETNPDSKEEEEEPSENKDKDEL